MEQPTFDYEIGQNVYAVWHDTGGISRYKVNCIKVEYRERGTRVVYHDGHAEVPRATGKTSWSRRACSVFLNRRDANRAARPFLERARQQRIERVQQEIEAKQAELQDLATKEIDR